MVREEGQPDLSYPELYSELNVSETVKRGTTPSGNLCSELISATCFLSTKAHPLSLHLIPERVVISIYIKGKLWRFYQLNTTSGCAQTVWCWQELVWIPKLLYLALLSPLMKCWTTFQTCARWLNSSACMTQPWAPCGDCQYQHESCTETDANRTMPRSSLHLALLDYP